jgi:hypothetical protein
MQKQKGRGHAWEGGAGGEKGKHKTYHNMCIPLNKKA